ncbi:MAG TPA: TonB-dependent receptor [Rhizomicrobium sp.]|nr:TonB-dependent receptor [Rhizomicrobium sp.]
MQKKWLIVPAVAALLLASQAYAADDSGSSVIVYQPDFFAAAHPTTAYDMIGRLPGFTFDDGNSARGFAGTAGNVLIDGQRPTSKTDDLQSVLSRIPAANVERIELIRGGASGIDMHGQTVVANVIRKSADSTTVVATVSDNIWMRTHETVPQIDVQFTQHSGNSTYEASATRYGNYDDSVGYGFHNVTDVNTGDVTHQRAYSDGRGSGGGATGAITTPLFGGQFKVNLALQASPFNSGDFYTAPGNDQAITDKSGSNNGELGLHWEGALGGTTLETLFLQRLGHQTDVNKSFAAGDDELFASDEDTGESIARVTLRWSPTSDLTFEGAIEGAYNFLNGTSRYVVNTVPQVIPSANAKVTEKRGEAFAQATWKISKEWSFEAGMRAELSTIGETGDVAQSRTFFYPKPRAVLTWSPDDKTQVRFRYERVLGQLDFSNFVASSNLSSTGVNAGNANLRPDVHDQFELSAERHFWDKGAVVVTLLHERIQDVEDYIPIVGATDIYDAPGNIGAGRNDQIDVELTLPLDKLGLPNGLIKATNIFRFSSVKDPETGQNRVISGERPQDIEWTLSQDIPSWNSTWSIFYFNCWDEHYYRLQQVRHRATIPPYFEVTWDYTPTPDWTFRLAVENAGAFTYDDTLYDYAGPRASNPLDEIEELSIKSQPRLYIRVRKTFN